MTEFDVALILMALPVVAVAWMTWDFFRKVEGDKRRD